MHSLIRFDALRLQLASLSGERSALLRSKDSLDIKQHKTEQDVENIKKARALLQLVAQRTQQELEIRIGALGSLALKTVFPEDPYRIILRFEQKRGRTEACLRFSRERDTMEIKPIDACGGGTVLVAAFALRLTFWKISHNRTAPIIFLDEPFHYLSKDLMDRAGEVLREIARKLNVQIIMVTHEEELLTGVDRVFHVRIQQGVSRVTRKELK